jgi:hypothetical protein
MAEVEAAVVTQLVLVVQVVVGLELCREQAHQEQQTLVVVAAVVILADPRTVATVGRVW